MRILKNLQISALLLTFLLANACKREPTYEVKDAFGRDTVINWDDDAQEPTRIRIKKRDFDRKRYIADREREKAIRKVMYQRRKAQD